VEHAADMSLKRHQRIPVPRSSYIHDWFLTERYALVLLHPVMLSLTRYLSGYASFTDSLRWQPEQGNLLLVVDRSGAQKPLLLDAPACFMWHSLNAYEQGDTIVADFVGYQQPDHFLGEHAAFHAIMQGQQGVQQASGQLQRYVVNFKQRHLSLEILSTSNCEFPMLDLRMATRPHRFGYCTTASGPTVFHHGLMRIDTDTGQQDVADMGDATHLGEPVFVSDDSAREDSGHLLSVGLDGASGNSFLAVFRADRLSDGPLARVWLTHPTPLSFHGYWHAA
jgi:all-trans-8'-apo-beta-carotenal 15,15'-oxygenase